MSEKAHNPCESFPSVADYGWGPIRCSSLHATHHYFLFCRTCVFEEHNTLDLERQQQLLLLCKTTTCREVLPSGSETVNPRDAHLRRAWQGPLRLRQVDRERCRTLPAIDWRWMYRRVERRGLCVAR